MQPYLDPTSCPPVAWLSEYRVPAARHHILSRLASPGFFPHLVAGGQPLTLPSGNTWTCLCLWQVTKILVNSPTAVSLQSLTPALLVELRARVALSTYLWLLSFWKFLPFAYSSVLFSLDTPAFLLHHFESSPTASCVLFLGVTPPCTT